jgi:ankyrin repeat protein
VVQKLVEVGGEQGVGEQDEHGVTPLHHAAGAGHEEVLTVLLSHGAQANSKDGQGKTPLMMASLGGHMVGVQKLLQVVGNQGLADTDEDGWTALHFAASRGRTEVVTLLSSRGAKVQSYNSEGNTPLMLACRNDCWVWCERFCGLPTRKD